MEIYDLAEQLRPKVLSEIKAQPQTIRILKAVVRNPSKAPKNFLLMGPSGCGKTTIARAIAREILKVSPDDDIYSAQNYYEYDAGTLNEEVTFQALLSRLRFAHEGFRVFCIDECHLIPIPFQGKLLKEMEEYIENTFIFFCTTDYDKVLDTLKLRMQELEVYEPTVKEKAEHVKATLNLLNKIISEDTINIIASRSFGGFRVVLKNLERCLFLGEEDYVATYRQIAEQISVFMKEGLVETLAKIPWNLLRIELRFWVRTQIVNEPKFTAKIFMAYLRLFEKVNSAEDFFSAMILLRNILRELLK